MSPVPRTVDSVRIFQQAAQGVEPLVSEMFQTQLVVIHTQIHVHPVRQIRQERTIHESAVGTETHVGSHLSCVPVDGRRCEIRMVHEQVQ